MINNKNWGLTLIFLMGFVCGTFMLLILLVVSQNAPVQIKMEAVNKECARYHPKTGKFEWIGKGN